MENLNKKYGGKQIINDVSFSVYKNDIFGLLGPNGSGKSTIMKLILGLIKKDSGEIFINSNSIDKNFKKAMSSIAAIIESPSLFYNMTAYENIKLMKIFANKDSKYTIEEIIDIVGLTGRDKEPVSKFSLGMKQRLGIAMALIRGAKIIILDEPTNGLDPNGIIEIRTIIKNLVTKHDRTVIISSHLLYEIELICNRALIIKNGNKIMEGDLSELLGDGGTRIKIISDEVREISNFLKLSNLGKIVDERNSSIIIESEKEPHIILKELTNNFKIDFFEREKITLEDKFIDIVGD